MRGIWNGLAGIAALATAGTASAQESARSAARVVDAVVACRSIADPAERVACYDRTTDALVTARERRDIVVVDREKVKETRRSLFGFGAPNLRLFGQSQAEAEADEAEIKEVSSKIRSIRGAGYGHYVMALEDGSVWQTTGDAGRFRPTPGSTLKIKRGALGSYRASLEGESGGYPRVKRVN